MGNRFGFCILHHVDGGIDTGEIIAFDEFLYPVEARRPIDYEKVYVERNLDFVISFIEKHRSSPLPLNTLCQPEYFSSYWPRLSTKVNGFINWGLDPIEIEKFICAFDEPYIGAHTLLNGRQVHLKSVSLCAQDGAFHSFQSGIIYRKGKSWLCVSLKGSSLIIEKLYDDDGNDILNSVRVGDRFVTPQPLLDAALSRAIYTPEGLMTSNNNS